MSSFFKKHKIQRPLSNHVRIGKYYYFLTSKLFAAIVALATACSPLSNLQEGSSLFSANPVGITLQLKNTSYAVPFGTDGGGIAVGEDGTVYNCSALNGTNASGCLAFRLQDNTPLKHGTNALVVTQTYILTQPDGTTNMQKCIFITGRCSTTNDTEDQYGGIVVKAPDGTEVFKVVTARLVCQAPQTATVNAPTSACSDEPLHQPYIVDFTDIESAPIMSPTDSIRVSGESKWTYTGILPDSGPPVTLKVAFTPERDTAVDKWCPTSTTCIKADIRDGTCSEVLNGGVYEAACGHKFWQNTGCTVERGEVYCSSPGGGVYKLYRTL